MDASCRDRARTRRRHVWRLGWMCCCALALAGCHAWQPARFNPPQLGWPPLPESNPVLVPTLDRDLVWETVADVVDDYFRIDREERPKLVGDLLTEGRLETSPRSGSTIFEPWNHDSTTPYERWESTLQSIRRRALVRVIPNTGGYQIEVQVIKELEVVSRPETGSISQANPGALRNDSSLQRVTNPVAGQSQTLDWMDVGRDFALEQEILAQIQARLGSVAMPPLPVGPEQLAPPPVEF